MIRQLCACLLNISEGRNVFLVEKVAEAAIAGNKDNGVKSAVLNIFSDKEYNRSVITIVGSAEHIGKSVVLACTEAYRCIDLSRHSGGHPRLGAVDLVPIHPLSADISLQQCGTIACDIALQLSHAVPGTSFFLFGSADHLNRGLSLRRKQVQWFTGERNKQVPDVGEQVTLRYGLTGAGAIPYVMNCNVSIKSKDLTLGRHIASQIRASAPHGLPGVQCMAFPHQDKIEIACNVEGFHVPHKEEKMFLESSKNLHRDSLICSFENWFHTPPKLIEDYVKKLANDVKVETEANVVVGFTPLEARNIAVKALQSGKYDFWRTRKSGNFM